MSFHLIGHRGQQQQEHISTHKLQRRLCCRYQFVLFSLLTYWREKVNLEQVRPCLLSRSMLHFRQWTESSLKSLQKYCQTVDKWRQQQPQKSIVNIISKLISLSSVTPGKQTLSHTGDSEDILHKLMMRMHGVCMLSRWHCHILLVDKSTLVR